MGKRREDIKGHTKTQIDTLKSDLLCQGKSLVALRDKEHKTH